MRRPGEGWMVCVLAAAAGLVLAPMAFAQTENKAKNLYTSQGKRDPFVPLITPAGYLVNLEPEKNASLNLEGIMFDPKGDSIAILNGELLRVGEAIGDAVLATIEADKVTIIQNNQKIEIELRREG